KQKKLVQRVLFYLAVIIISFITIFPIYWMMVATFQPSKYTLSYPPPLFPQEITFRQFTDLFQNYPIARWIMNSFLISAMSTIVCTGLTVIGAYALSNLRWRGQGSFGVFLLITQMLPEILIVIPLYMIYQRLNLLDQLPALSLISAAFSLPICIWILKGVFDTVPVEVLNAAEVDGCTAWSALWRIVLPLSAPGLVAVAVVACFAAWNEFLFAALLLTSSEHQPATVGLATLKGTASTPVGQYMASGLIFSILPVLFYLFMQRYIVSGLTAGAVKG